MLSTHIISPTIFGEPRIAVFSFLFCLLFVSMGAVFRRSSVLTLILEEGRVLGKPMILLKTIELLCIPKLRGYILV